MSRNPHISFVIISRLTFTDIDDAQFFSDLKITSITKETHREHEQTRSAKGRSQKKFGSGAPRPPSNPHDDLTARSIRELLSVRN